MLTLYKARTVYAAADRVLSEVGARAGKHIVIAPDPFTLAVEESISDKLGKKGIFDIEVMSFARLAGVVLGSKIKKCLSPAGSVMLMEKVVSAEKESLRYYRRAADKPGFASEMYAAITSIRNSGVTAEQLTSAAEKLKGHIAEKTQDIAFLYASYLRELALNHTDGTTRLEALVAAIRESEEFGDTHFYVVDHVDLNAKQLEVLAALMPVAASLSVAVADGEGADNARIYPLLLDKLRARAEKEGVRFKEISVPALPEGARAAIAEELFSYSFSPSMTENIRLAEAKNPEEELTCLATEITRLVRKEGLRYADIAVISPSFEEYLPSFERIFRRYEIPYFADVRNPLSESDVFRHVLSAMEVVTSGFDASLLRRYLTHALFGGEGITSSDKAAFCDYTDRCGVNHFAFKEPFQLYRDDPIYDGAERVRAALFKEIEVLVNLPRTGRVRLYAEALRTFLAVNDFDQRIADYTRQVHDAGLFKEAEIIRQTPAALMELLDSLVDLRGEEETSFAAFLTSLTSGAEQVKIAALPVSLDSVYFAPVKQAMYAPIPALFVIGAEEGLFPLEQVGEGIIGAREYAAWQGNGIEIKIENTGVEELAASRFHALQLLLRADRLYLSHREGKNPSPCIRQLRELFFPKGGKEGDPLPIEKCESILLSYDLALRVPTKKVAESLLAECSGKSREGLLGARGAKLPLAIAEVLGSPFPLPYSADMPNEVRPDVFFRDSTVSTSKLETYFRCPFLHFVKYGLNAREKEVAEHDPRDVGNIAHSCMEIFVREYVMRRKKGEIGDDEAREIAAGIAGRIVKEPRYLAIAKQEGEAVLQRQIKRCREIAVTVKNQIYQSNFVPTLFEEPFGGKKEGVLSTVDLGGVSLRGKIDRVDILPESPFGDDRKFAVAVDYKTGSNMIKTKELYYGQKVQLPLYLAVLERSGYSPAAALYASLSDANTPGKRYLYGPKRKDLFLMRALDNSLVAESPSSYAGIAFDKEGRMKEECLVTEEELRAQTDYAVRLSSGAVKEVMGGFVRPSPTRDGRRVQCDFCEIKTICRHAGENIRDLSKGNPDAKNILEIMQKEEENGDR